VSERNWTPGPWVVDRYGDLRSGESIVSIAGVSIPCGYRDKSDECYANQRLAGAAPDMYEALEAVCAAVRIEGLHTAKAWRGLIDYAEFALKKARGEQ
jgi:hypothetical protein